MNSNVKKILDNFGARVIKLAKINIGATRTVKGKKRRIDNSGDLRRSLDYELDISKKEVGGVPTSFGFYIESEDYAKWVDGGRKPGKGMPPDKLMSWIKSKPIRLRDLKTKSFVKATPSRLKSLAFLINRKIKEKGIEPTYFLTEPIEKEFKTLPDDLIEAYGLDIENFLKKILNGN